MNEKTKHAKRALENKMTNITNIVLEKATPEDIPKYIEIDTKVSGRTYSAILTDEAARKELATCTVYMIKKDDQIVGSISYKIKEDGTAYISGIAVDPAFQGNGIGRQAIEQVLLEVADAPKVELVTHPDNHRAVSLYESLGFKIGERKENCFGDGEPRVVLTLTREK